MAEQSSTTTTPPAVINGFDRLTAATQLPQPPAAQPPPPPNSGAPDTDPSPTPIASAPALDTTTEAAPAASVATEEPTPYRSAPHLLPEHALLGSLLHAPAVLDELEDFLGVRDFATPDTRAVYATLRGLHRADALIDVAAQPTTAEQLRAAYDNHLRLADALRTKPFTSLTVGNVPRLIALLTAAAPPESLPFRGVYDPRAQLHLGRMVLEDSCRRQLRAMGVLMRRAPKAPSTQPGHTADNLSARLHSIDTQLDQLSTRFSRAVQRTNPTASTSGRHRAAEPPPSPRRRLPDQLRPITAPLQHRAERHLLHLALHAGRSELIPDQLLDLQPEDFTSTRNANLWRTISDLHAQNLPINYVSVFHATRADGFTHRPMPSDRTLIRLAQPPQINPERIARSLRTVITTALARATTDASQTLDVLANATATPVDALLGQARTTIDRVAGRHHASPTQLRRR